MRFEFITVAARTVVSPSIFIWSGALAWAPRLAVLYPPGPFQTRAFPSLTAVLVVQTHDVVFAEVRARLHLDDLERHLARVLETVRHP